VSLPYVDIGRRALQLLDRKNFTAERILLNTSFIGRSSTGEQLRSVSAELKDSRERSFNL
jgi:formylmethanofuran dehydrogenase subunit E